jgi:hypothetical protein
MSLELVRLARDRPCARAHADRQLAVHLFRPLREPSRGGWLRRRRRRTTLIPFSATETGTKSSLGARAGRGGAPFAACARTRTLRHLQAYSAIRAGRGGGVRKRRVRQTPGAPASDSNAAQVIK